MNRAGLKKVTKTVRGKKGSVTRTYWVKATTAVKGAARKIGGFVGSHKGKIAAGAALAGAAYLAHKHGGSKAFGDFLKRHRESKERGLVLAKNMDNIRTNHDNINSTQKQQDAAQARIDHDTAHMERRAKAARQSAHEAMAEAKRQREATSRELDHLERQVSNMENEVQRTSGRKSRRKKAN